MMKAPKADEKPTFVEKTAMAQHMPRETMSSTSALMSWRTDRRNSGTAKIQNEMTDEEQEMFNYVYRLVQEEARQ